MKLYILPLLLVTFVTSNPLDVKVKKHPGCLIWWFAPDCAFATVFGSDPLNIYPWGKFCKKYSAFQNTKFCIKNEDEVMVDSNQEELIETEDQVLKEVLEKEHENVCI